MSAGDNADKNKFWTLFHVIILKQLITVKAGIENW